MLFAKNCNRPVAYSAFPAALVLAGALLICSNSLSAQSNGPLAPATPSDQPVASAPPASPASSNNRIGDKPNLAGTWKENKSQSDDPREKMRQAAQQSGNGNNDPDANPNAGQNGPRGGWGGGPGYGGGGGGLGGPGQAGGYPGGPGGGGWGGPGGQNPQNGPYGGPNGDPNSGGPNPNNGGNENAAGLRGDEQLTIEQTPTAARVSNASGRLIAAYAATDQDQPSAANNSSTSDDNGGKRNRRNRNTPAVAQWQGDQLVATTQMGGGSTTRTYELSPNGRQLIVTTKIENRRLNSPVTYRLVYDPVTVSNDGKNQ